MTGIRSTFPVYGEIHSRRVFDQHVANRASRSRKKSDSDTEDGGVGLALRITWMVVDRHGGRISLSGLEDGLDVKLIPRRRKSAPADGSERRVTSGSPPRITAPFPISPHIAGMIGLHGRRLRICSPPRTNGKEQTC